MTTWGKKLGRGSNSRLGTGVQVAPGSEPKPLVINYDSFRNGLMVADRSADVPAGFYCEAVDVETSRRDGVTWAPGVTLSENTGHSLQWLGIHTSLDFQSVLVAFDAPYIGVKEGGNFVWTLSTIADGDFWVTSRYGDVLLFTNGIKSYSRQYDSGAIAEVPDMPGAATLFTAFGRVFAGGTIIGGEYNLLGLMWSGVSGDYTDWTGLGSGAELLIADVEQSDKIVAGRVLSYDLAVILCRRSLWLAARTGLVDRPADIQFRLLGIGCVSEPTARTTEGGVTFLSDEGVRHFDGNNAEIISGAINAELLPLDFTNLAKYKSAWDASRRRYILTTPTATYIYQFRTAEYPNGAWFKRSILATNVVVFGRQAADPTWADFANQTWDQLGDVSWFQLATPESTAAPDVIFVSGSAYGLQDSAATSNFGNPLAPLFQPRPTDKTIVDLPDHIFATEAFLLEYAGAGTVNVIGLDELGSPAVLATQVLTQQAKPRSVRVDKLISSRGVGIWLQITAGSPELFKIRHTLLDNGPALDDVVTDELLSEVATDLLTEANNGIILWP